jgi:predicted nucleic acid-binding Zn ribbon protein
MSVCKYCGAEIKQSGAQGWVSPGTGWTCANSPNKKHLMSSGAAMICAYCGKSVKHSGAQGLAAPGTGWTCANSPNKKHCLP